MANWKLKAIVQGGVSVLPRPHLWNHLFHKYVTKALVLNEGEFENKLSKCRKHLDNYLNNSSPPRKPFNVFELGTGWYPIIPIGLYLAGASQVWSFDKSSHLSINRVKETLRWFVKYAECGKLFELIPQVDKNKMPYLKKMLEDKGIKSPKDILDKLHIHVEICDARGTNLGDSTIDFITSNSTIEYIPEEILVGIFKEFYRIATPKAVMSHFSPLGDHYADFDSSINHFNFLQYSHSKWQFYNSSLHYQNRLRISDYRTIHHSAGFKILSETNTKGL